MIVKDSHSRVDLIDCFYEILVKTEDILPEIFYTLKYENISAYLSTTLNFIINVADYKAFKSMTIFVLLFVREEEFKSIMMEQFFNVVKCFIECMVIHPRSFMDYISLIFQILNETFPDVLTATLTNIFNSNDTFPKESLTSNAKQKFAEGILNSKTAKDYEYIVNEFYDECQM